MPKRNRGPHLRFLERRKVYYIVWYVGGCENLRSTGTADLVEAERILLEFRGDGTLPAAITRREPESEYIYFVGGDVGAIKIGLSQDPAGRLRSLQCGSPIPLSLLAVRLGTRTTEYLYHGRFAEHRLHGEWFDRHPDIMAEIQRLNAEELAA